MSHSSAERDEVINAAIAIVYNGNSDSAWHRIRRAIERMEASERQTNNHVDCEDLLAVMNRICHHQVAKGAQPLTCGNDSRHQILFPVIHGRRVVLRCPDCDYAQERVPTV